MAKLQIHIHQNLNRKANIDNLNAWETNTNGLEDKGTVTTEAKDLNETKDTFVNYKMDTFTDTIRIVHMYAVNTLDQNIVMKPGNENVKTKEHQEVWRTNKS